MKIVVIHGSMRKGNTYALTGEILSRLKAKPDVQIKEIDVAELELPFCRSCHLCLNKGEEFCPHYAIIKAVRSALIESDGIILSGATYIRSLNAAMKNLLDHLAYMFHRPVLFDKKGIVVATSAGMGEANVAEYLKDVLGQFGVNGAQVVTKKTRGHNAQIELEFTKKEAKRLDETVERFYKLIKMNKRIAPKMKDLFSHNAFRVMSQSEFADSPRDTEFWKQDGYYNKVYPKKIGVFKLVMGRIMHGNIKILVKIIGRAYKKKQK
jgi:multimeric flavodoxin WrbA